MKKADSPQALPVLTPWEKCYEAEGETVLTAKSLLPRCPEGQPGARRFNRFYHHLNRCFQRRVLLLSAEAQADLARARAASLWFSPLTAALTAQLEVGGESEAGEGVLTVRWQLAESGGFTCAGEEQWSMPGLLLLS